MKKLVRVAAIIVPLAFVVGACGSSSSTSSTATTAAAADTTAAAADTTAAAADTTAAAGADTTAAAAGSGGMEAAQAAVTAGLVPATKIGPTVKLGSVPPKKKVAWLECELPSCTAITPGFVDATKALGWDLMTIPSKSFDPAPAFQQAIDAGVDYIAVTGTPLALLKEQVAAAQAKGIKYFSCYATDDPGQEANNLYMQCGDEPGVKVWGGLTSNWVVVDSGGKANMLIVNIPDFPILISVADGAKKAFADNCPGCKASELDVTIDDLTGGKVPAAVASKLQADPTINYVYFTFGDLPAGVADTLEQNGLLKQVKIVGQDFSVAQGIEEIIKGRHFAWSADPKPYAAWLMVDGMARDSIGEKNTEERTTDMMPNYLVASKEAAQQVKDEGDWSGPAGMADQFKALWGV